MNYWRSTVDGVTVAHVLRWTGKHGDMQQDRQGRQGIMGDVVKAKIRKWFGDKGFGFARPADAGPRDRDRDVFVHARALDLSLQHLTRLDFPVMTAEGRPDFANSPQWPDVFIEAEPSEKGLRAVRVSDTDFQPGDLESSPAAGGAPSARVTSATFAGPRNVPRSQRGPQSVAEDSRRSRLEDKKGGGRRGSWDGRDDDF